MKKYIATMIVIIVLLAAVCTFIGARTGTSTFVGLNGFSFGIQIAPGIQINTDPKPVAPTFKEYRSPHNNECLYKCG
jgi:hypothetical protein